MVNISLIVTTHNNSKQLNDFVPVWSAYLQYVSELIVVDDCSTDDTCTRLMEIFKAEKEMKIFQTSSNSGRPSIPRNLGVEKSSSDRLIFADCDDVIPLKYLKFLRSLPAIDKNVYSLSRYDMINHDRSLLFQHVNSISFTKVSKTLLYFKNTLSFSGSSVCATIARENDFENIFLEDWRYWRKLAASNSIHFYRMKNLFLGYNCAPSLSPRKAIQVTRVASLIGWRNIPIYIFLTIFLIIERKIANYAICINNERD
jgi:teichuronic acid biosynthesis glycosyltransferase TuaG